MKSKTKYISNIIQLLEIIESAEDNNYIFRGENKKYEEISSRLYRQHNKKTDDDKIINFNIREYEKDIIIKTAQRHISNSDTEILTQIQHYGGTTNLIDFTNNILIALFFACDGKYEQEGRIICFDTSKVKLLTKIDYNNTDKYNIIDPTDKSPRVIFQSSIFIHTQKGYIEDSNYTEIIIKSVNKKSILQYLKKYFNIQYKTIYNDIHGFIKNQDNDYISFKSSFTETTENIKKQDTFDKSNFKSAKVFCDKGNENLKLKKYEEAIKYFDEAIELDPLFADAYYNRGVTKGILKQYQNAINDYDEVIKLDPKNANAFYNRGQLQVALKKYEKAIKDYKQAKILYEQKDKIKFADQIKALDNKIKRIFNTIKTQKD